LTWSKRQKTSDDSILLKFLRLQSESFDTWKKLLRACQHQKLYYITCLWD